MRAAKPSSEVTHKILKKKLKEDLEDEDEAIGTYGQRINQAKSVPLAKRKLKHIRADEQEHKKKIGSILKLKRVKG